MRKQWQVSARFRYDLKICKLIFQTRKEVAEQIKFFQSRPKVFLPKVWVREQEVGPWKQVSPSAFKEPKK